ncbi:MAG: hypothetical protein ACK55K_04655 [Bacteroidota bacterium]
MNKPFILSIAGILLLFSCQKQQVSESFAAEIPDPQPLSASEIDQLIFKSLETTARFEWGRRGHRLFGVRVN